MSAMEQSLRRALEGGDAGDPAFREAIYSASERALERMLARRGIGEEAAQLQRIRLAETINRVEDDYFAASAGPLAETSLPDEQDAAEAGWGGEDAPADLVPAAVSGSAYDDPDEDGGGSIGTDAPAGREEPADMADPGEDEAGFEVRAPDAGRPDLEGPRRAGAPASVSLPADDTRIGFPARDPKGKAEAREGKGRLRPFGVGLVALLLLLGLGAYLYASLVGPLPFFTSVSGGTAEGSGAAVTAEAADWILLFDGTRLEAIATPNGGRVAAIAGAGGRAAVRIAAASEGGEIAVQVGAGVVGAIRGRTLRVEIVAGSPDGGSREFGVRCLFGGDTACGRQRFNTVQPSEAFVFDMRVPPSAPTTGAIALEPGFGDTAGRDLDLYSVRLRPVAE